MKKNSLLKLANLIVIILLVVVLGDQLVNWARRAGLATEQNQLINKWHH